MFESLLEVKVSFKKTEKQGEDIHIYQLSGLNVGIRQHQLIIDTINDQEQKYKDTKHKVQIKLVNYLVREGNYDKLMKMRLEWIKQFRLDRLVKKPKQNGKLVHFQSLCNVPLTSLEFLMLHRCSLVDEECSSIYKAIFQNLTKLDLSYNQISDKGCQYLSEGKWPHLQELYLGNNMIGYEGCKYLIQGQWPNLEIARFPKNRLDQKSCKYLSKANWPQLKDLRMNQNIVYDRGCLWLKEGNWLHIERLQLGSNGLKSKGGQHILKIVLINKGYLDIRKKRLFEDSVFRRADTPSPQTAKQNKRTPMTLTANIVGRTGVDQSSSENSDSEKPKSNVLIRIDQKSESKKSTGIFGNSNPPPLFGTTTKKTQDEAFQRKIGTGGLFGKKK